jgi:hypothetical protein
MRQEVGVLMNFKIGTAGGIAPTLAKRREDGAASLVVVLTRS